MNTEEKAKAYDEALDRCKEWASGTWGHSIDDSPKDIAEFIFPQLAESEDERTRREIIDFIQWAEDRGMTRHDYHQAKRPSVWIAYLEKQKEPHFTKRNALFDKCVENCDPKVMKEVSDKVDAMLEKEQKPVDFPTTDEEVKEFLETHPKVEVPEKYKTPDFVFSKQEYESHPIISKDTTSVKPAEWSEEDRLHYTNVLEALEYVKGCKSDYDKIEAVKSDIAWLKLLRNRVGKDSLQPHWKPSEEQMKEFKGYIEDSQARAEAAVGGWNNFDVMIRLYEQLKKLM